MISPNQTNLSADRSSLYTTLAARIVSLPLIVAAVFVMIGGLFLLKRADAQGRDTTRKHHLQDIEDSLYFARNQYGTFPPYNSPTWCGVLSDPASEPVRQQIEDALRQRIDKYANTDKPFPADPLFSGQSQDYFYWKRSPAVFELYAVLEQDQNGERSTRDCPGSPAVDYDYGITSVWREAAR